MCENLRGKCSSVQFVQTDFLLQFCWENKNKPCFLFFGVVLLCTPKIANAHTHSLAAETGYRRKKGQHPRLLPPHRPAVPTEASGCTSWRPTARSCSGATAPGAAPSRACSGR